MSASSERPHLNRPNSSSFGTVVVFGISGVGKSTACVSYVSRHPTVLHTSAGALLQEAKRTESSLLRIQDPQSILRNQNLLCAALARFRLGREDADILIDAHSIIDNGHELVEIPVDTVRAINPSGLILLEAPAELVFERRQKDSRSRPLRSVEELQLQMNIAREVCRNYGRELSLPLEIGAVSHEQDLDTLINRMVCRREN